MQIPGSAVLAIRDALLVGDAEEAYHMLRMAVDPACEIYKARGDHWREAEDEARAELRAAK